MFVTEIELPASLRYENNAILLDLTDPYQNLISIDNTDYIISYLKNKIPGNKGGNSFIFTLTPAQEYEDGVTPTHVLKICKYTFKGNKFYKSIHKRFYREVEALFECKKRNFSNVIEIYHSGILKTSKNDRFLFYTMEYSESDIKVFFENNQLPLFNRIDLCLSLAYGIEELHSLEYYHRDIKPDNIFVFDDTFKLGDLGLISFRDDDLAADENRIIGPKGWISPEAMNKYLTENLDSELRYDCGIDYQSDIFQLGMVFWYIIQGNAPIGSIRESDFKRKKSMMYPLLRTMLNHNKRRRPINIEEVIYQLKLIHNKQLSLVE